jgi:hypothetical protein
LRYRKLSNTDDYVFGNGQLDFYRDVPEAVAQAAKTRLLLWLGEWFLNLEEGTPYLLGILGKYSKETADATIQDRVEGTQGFVNIEEYESAVDQETRAMFVSMLINTIYGPTVLQVENYTKY